MVKNSHSFGYKNWINYGWGQELDREWSAGLDLVIDFRDVGNMIALSPLEAAELTVKTITTTHPGPYHLLCSGGIDSQAMLWAWLQWGSDFTVNSFSYQHNGCEFNGHDIQTLFEFLSSLSFNVAVNRHIFDPVDFYESSNYKTYSHRYSCYSPHILTYLKMQESLPAGTRIFAGNFLQKNSTTGQINSSLDWSILGPQRYLEIENVSLIPAFFLETPQLAYAWINSSLTVDDYYQQKTLLYQTAGFPVIAQEKKYTGFEKIKEYYDSQQHRITNTMKLKYAHRPSRRVFDLLFRYSLENYSEPKQQSKIINKLINF